MSTGYAVTGLLLVLVVITDTVTELEPGRILVALAFVKAGTNTLQWLAVRRGTGLLLAGTLNVFADVILITAAVHFTGGTESVLFPLYMVVLTLVGLLANPPITVILAVFMVLAYETMVLGVKFGFLVQHPEIFHPEHPVHLTWGYVFTDMVKLVFFLSFICMGVTAVLRELRSTEEALEEANEELRAANQRRDEFIASVTHELKTPIHGVMGLTELVREGVYGDVSEKQEEALGGIERGTNRLLAMVEDLLQFQRVISGQISLRPEQFELSTFIDEVLEGTDWASEQRTVELQMEIPNIEVEIDRQIFGHVLHNLVTHALKFSPEGGTVLLRFDVRGDGDLDLVVADQGPGVSPDEQVEIFEAYWKVQDSVRAFGGTGLALAVSKSLADVLGGEIAVQNLEPGARFTVRFRDVVVSDGESSVGDSSGV